MPQDLKNFLVWVATIIICIAVFLFFNYMFTSVLRLEWLGTILALIASVLILGAGND